MPMDSPCRLFKRVNLPPADVSFRFWQNGKVAVTMKQTLTSAELNMVVKLSVTSRTVSVCLAGEIV